MIEVYQAGTGDRDGTRIDPMVVAYREAGQLPLVPRPAHVIAAADEWGLNCGPAAICAALGLAPADLRPHLQDFEVRGYSNPTLMRATLASLGVPWRETYRSNDRPSPTSEADAWLDPVGVHAPGLALVRIQWDGKWCDPGVPMAARYRNTHWIATVDHGNYVYDVNAVRWTSGWVPRERWVRGLVPWLLDRAVKRNNGRWWPANVWILPRPEPT